MSVPTTLSNTTFTGIVDGVALDCLFNVENTAHLEVTYGADVVAVLGVDYTVALFAPAYDHATVTPIVGFAATSGGTINVARKVPIVQTLTIPTLAEIASARLEQAFDYLTYITTYLRDRLTFSLAYPKTDDPTMNIGPLPVAADRAGKILGFDANGRPAAVTVSTTGAQAFSAFGSAWALVANAANAMTSLGFSAYMAGLKGTASLTALQTALGMSAFFKTLLPAADAAAARTTLGVNSTAQIANLFPRGLLAGLTLSTAGGSATFGIAAGSAADSTNVDVINLAAAITKTTGAWAVGSGNGGLDTGAIANNTQYHAHLIKSNDGLTVDAVISLSATAPTLPAGYTAFRRIGPLKTNGAAQWVSFLQVGDKFTIAPANDYVAGGIVATALRTLASVPTGIVVDVLGTAIMGAGGGGSTTMQFAPAAMVAAVQQLSVSDNSVAFSMQVPVLPVTSNTAGQIYIGASAFTGTATFVTHGWIDRRGRDS